MKYRVLIYCPDRHFYYTAPEINRHGAGGGLIARIRLAEALAGLGHRVTVVSHVKYPHTFRNVRYLPLAKRDKVRRADVLILVSSGGELSLEEAVDWGISAELRVVWVHGKQWIRGIDKIDWDYIVVPSNFLLESLQREWKLQKKKWWVFYNGVTAHRVGFLKPRRDIHRVIYAGHPSKGIESALAVLRYLREEDSRYHLWVFGGPGLWGQDERSFSVGERDGVKYFGTQSQAKLYRAFLSSHVSILLQAREEPFGMVLTEGMMAGTIPVASPVGAFNELVEHGYNGLLVRGEHLAPATQKKAASWILMLSNAPEFSSFIRANAHKTPLLWTTVALAWEGWWDWLFFGEKLVISQGCLHCGGDVVVLADGYHCLSCGRYFRKLRETEL